MRGALTTLILLGALGVVTAWFAIAHRTNEAPMNSILPNYNPLVVRTDFSDDDAWQAVRAGVLEIPPDVREYIVAMKAINAAAGVDVSGFGEPVEFVNIVDDVQNAGRGTDEVLQLAAEHDACVFVVDRQTISSADHPVLVVDLSHERGRTFRAIPTEVGGIASNLSIANMDWEDFADNVDPDGVFRGLSQGAP